MAEMMDVDNDECILCNETLSDSTVPTVKLGEKGMSGLQKAINARNDSFTIAVGQVVHVHCRKEYTNTNVISALKRKLSAPTERNSKNLRSQEVKFNYKTNCLFCGQGDPYQGRKTDFKLNPIMTLDYSSTCLKICDKLNSPWSDEVKDRMLFCPDLPAADAVYHKVCSTNFRTGRDVPRIFEQGGSKVKNVGRPQEEERENAFKMVVKYLEQAEDEQISIEDTLEKMNEYLEGNEPFSCR